MLKRYDIVLSLSDYEFKELVGALEFYILYEEDNAMNAFFRALIDDITTQRNAHENKDH